MKIEIPRPALKGLKALVVGFACAYLATPYARRVSGETMFVDAGVNIMA